MKRVFALAACLISALAVVAWVAGLDGAARVPADEGDAASPSRRLSALPVSTSEPWADAIVATVLAGRGGPVIALVGAAASEPPRALLSGPEEIEEPAWSPDGTWLAFAGRRDGNWDLFAVRRDQATVRRLTNDPAFDGWPAWSPDGTELAFVSHRDGRLAVHRLDLDTLRVSPALSSGSGPSIEPAWSPDGRWIAYASWSGGTYRLETVETGLDQPIQSDRAPWTRTRVLAEPATGADFRSPSWSPDGRTFAWLKSRHGTGQVLTADWDAAGGRIVALADARAADATGYAFSPDGGAIAVAVAERRARNLVLVPLGGGRPVRLGSWPRGPSDVSWTSGPMPEGLGPAHPDNPVAETTPSRETRPGLAALEGVDVPGNRINAALLADFESLRRQVRSETGRDFLQTLSDGWRPLGFQSDASSFFSWHKVGRAFDTVMELRGPGYRRDMLLVREDTQGRTMWRMYLRAATDDGSSGRPLTEPGWLFSAGGGPSEAHVDGGEREPTISDGYWVDFTALAEGHGWDRIPSITQGNMDWRYDWAGLDYWHYERRDGLTWYEAARQAYSDDELRRELAPERLRALNVAPRRLARAGFPVGWPEDT